MKILFDECVTKRLKPYLSEFEVFTVSEMKWNGLKNGDLMALCIDNNFDLLLTIDKNLMFQQNLAKYKLTLAVLNSETSKIEELVLFVPSFKSQVDKFEKAQGLHDRKVRRIHNRRFEETGWYYATSPPRWISNQPQ